MRSKLFFLLLLSFFMAGCSTHKKKKQKLKKEDTLSFSDTPAKEEEPSEGKQYRPAARRDHDLLHTLLDIQLDYAREFVLGKATLQLRPYFYPTKSLDLDAKGFELKEVSILKAGGKRDTLAYTYDGLKLHIQLDRSYTNAETYQLYIDYIAKPSERKEPGSSAITDTKGLYFINPDGKQKNKPRQVWTQGETQYSSCWFPTIDETNEKMTQEIYLTVDEKDLTLSNGELMYSNYNSNGTRTDYWKQDLPHSPYLTMIAVGNFAIVKDKWRGMEVSYYVEPEYKPYAKLIFGNTPAMLEFFSKRLGVDYPWKKFSQIVVRDFVSGAMENTSAVVHFEGLQHDARAHLDESYEDIISHELFHHWFGDLVTCESWANLPLNESFATYGEYLWREFKYGREDADIHLKQDYDGYMAEAMRVKKRLIRYHYLNREDMFDGHSYQKGALVLHMLRGHLGDEAFFKGLNLYLTQHKFKSAEIHDLRIAFEEVCGEDLNWFFNQWFFQKGHPELEIAWTYQATQQVVELTVEQMQNIDESGFYHMPIKVDIYINSQAERHELLLDEKRNTFRIPVSQKPDWVNIDAEKTLLCTKKDYKQLNEWTYAYDHAANLKDRLEAFNMLSGDEVGDSLTLITVGKAIQDKNWFMRLQALNALQVLNWRKIESFERELKRLALDDPKSAVRNEAINCLDRIKTPALLPFMLSCANDSSYMVMGNSMRIIHALSKDTGLMLAENARHIEDASVQSYVADILAADGRGDYQQYFEELFEKNSFTALFSYGNYMKRLEGERLDRAISFLEKISKEERKNAYVTYLIYGIAAELQDKYEDIIKTNTEKRNKLKPSDPARLPYDDIILKAKLISERLGKIASKK